MQITFVVTVRNADSGRESATRVNATLAEVEADEAGVRQEIGRIAVADFERRKDGAFEVVSIERARRR